MAYKPPWENEYIRQHLTQDFSSLEERVIAAEMERLLRSPNYTSAKPRQTQRVLPAFSGTYLVTFIGGPKNGTQEFLDSRAHPYIEDGKTWLVSMFEEANPLQGPQSSRRETYRYKTVFIPQPETSFTEDICIIALFQP